MKSISLIVATATLMASGVAMANGEQLAKEKNCMACHALDKKVVGPSYKEVAAKYAGDKGAEAKLAEKIIKGGAGVWGSVAMPPHPQVSADEAKTLAKYVLSIK
jgi:cytochrome c